MFVQQQHPWTLCNDPELLFTSVQSAVPPAVSGGAVDTITASASAATSSKTKGVEETMEDKKKDQNCDDNDDDSTPLEKTVLDQFTADMLQGCLEVLTGMPGTVFKACDVLSVVAQRNGEEWKENTMMHVLKQVWCCVLFLLRAKIGQ